MRRLLVIFLFFVFLLGCKASVNFLAHDGEIAAKRAIEFAGKALIEGKYQEAYALISKEGQRSVNLEQFQEYMHKMHPEGFPSAIEATEFEPISGQHEMNIFLVGTHRSKRIYYRLIMEETAPAGYTVVGIYRKADPYLPSKTKMALKRPISIGDQEPAMNPAQPRLDGSFNTKI
jgi:hypothetical protein